MRRTEPLETAELLLETPRLRLRPFALEDIDLARILLTDPAVMKYVAECCAVAELPAKTSEAAKRGAGGRIGIWCVTDKASGGPTRKRSRPFA